MPDNESKVPDDVSPEPEDRAEQAVDAADAEDVEGAEDDREAEAPPELGHTPADSATMDDPAPGETVALPPEDVEYVDLVKIHNVGSIAEARLVKGTLESFHIPSVVEDDVMETLQGFLPSQLDGIDIFVPAEFEARARAVLCERGIVCGLDQKEVEAFLAEKVVPAFEGGEAEREALGAALAEAPSRDFRREVLARIARRGKAGLEIVRDLLRSACRAGATEPRAEAEGASDLHPLVADVPKLADSGTFGPEAPVAIVSDLARLASDPSPEVRRRAAAALGRIRGAGAGAALVTLLDDPERDVRDEAIESLFALSSGETFGYDPDADPGRQHEPIARWREWVRENPAA